MSERTAICLFIAVIAVPLLGCGEPEPPLTVIRGTLLGHDGRPMPMAHVHLSSVSDFFRKEPFESLEVDADGSFEFKTARTGAFLLKFSGVDHAITALPLVADPPMELAVDVRLPTYAYNEDFSGVKIFGDFNEWNFASALPMEALSDGTYALMIETDADTVAYGLAGVIQGMGEYAVNGTQSDGFAFSGKENHHYRSLVEVPEGRVTIVFDPEQLDQSDEPAFSWEYGMSDKAAISFRDSTSVLARLKAMVKEGREYSQALWAAESTDSARAEAEGLVAAKIEKANAELDLLARQALFLEILEAAEAGLDIDGATLRQALVEVPPTSPLWSFVAAYVPGFVAAPFGGIDTIAASAARSGQVEECPFDEYLAYLEDGAALHPDSAVQSMMLYGMLEIASKANREDLAGEYYQRLRDGYLESIGIYFAKRYAPDRAIKVGNPIPDFGLVSLDDPEVVYTRESMLGRTYLLDFWATWCGPCVAEMASLHQVYQDYAPLGLEILSVSMDESPDAVRQFRAGEWKMPWLHTQVGGDFQTGPAVQFELIGIPNAILVDANGTIIAFGQENMLGENLRQVLVEFLGET